MLFMMLIGAPPYQAPQTQNAAFKYIISGRVADVLKHWKRLRLLTEDAVDLLNKMLCYEPHRISMADVLKHPFLAVEWFICSHPCTLSLDRSISMDLDLQI